ncbi:MAG TPA: Uma2 family endonuclease, partial [Isosphaeraceae bacterium]
MSQTTAISPRRTVADLLKELGDIPADRVRLHPTPGTATEQDVLDIEAREGRLCELVDGVLVEKVMGYSGSRLAAELIISLGIFLRRHNLGVVAGADGMLKLTTGLVRIPDVSFVSWDRLPGRRVPPEPIPLLPIDLAVEVISKGNTRAEMERKLREYLASGARLVWFIYPKTRTARVYTSPRQATLLKEDGVLDGGAVL